MLLGHYEGIYSFVLYKVVRIRDASEQVLAGQSRIVAQDFRLGPTLCHQSEQEINTETSSAHDRLAEQDAWVENDAILIRHAGLLVTILSFCQPPRASPSHKSAPPRRHPPAPDRPI